MTKEEMTSEFSPDVDQKTSSLLVSTNIECCNKFIELNKERCEEQSQENVALATKLLNANTYNFNECTSTTKEPEQNISFQEHKETNCENSCTNSNDITEKNENNDNKHNSDYTRNSYYCSKLTDNSLSRYEFITTSQIESMRINESVFDSTYEKMEEYSENNNACDVRNVKSRHSEHNELLEEVEKNNSKLVNRHNNKEVNSTDTDVNISNSKKTTTSNDEGRREDAWSCENDLEPEEFSVDERKILCTREGNSGIVNNTFNKASKAMYFWGSLVATAVPGYLGKKTGLTSQFLHWNYIIPHLLLGAIPIVTQVGASGDHLDQLRRQLESRNETLGLVVACLEDDELNGFGMNFIQFAKEIDWRREVNRHVEYVKLSMEDTKAAVKLEAVVDAVEKLHLCIDVNKQTAYVHCKAGKGRSWMIVMCYLTTYGGLPFDCAARLVQDRRGQINPSLAQQCFAREFAVRVEQSKLLKSYEPIREQLRHNHEHENHENEEEELPNKKERRVAC